MRPLGLIPLAAHKVLDPTAIIKDVVALHVNIGHTGRASISTQIAQLRALLLVTTSPDSSSSTTPRYFALAASGKIPLVINTGKADIIASIILLKREVDHATGKALKWIMSVLPLCPFPFPSPNLPTFFFIFFI